MIGRDHNGALDARFREMTPRSFAAFTRMQEVMPGGTCRALSAHPPYPLTIDCGEGPFLWDIDGNRYIDGVSNMFTMAHGNAFPAITAAVTSQLAKGTVYAANNEPQLALAELIQSRVPSVEHLVFCNSGLEAFSTALNVARGYTGRKKFLMAIGGYHGMLYDTVQGGKGVEGPYSLVAPYGDAEAFVATIDDHAGDLCAVFIEGVMGSASFTSAPPGFLRAVYDACRRNDILFVLDEVITMRLAVGGYQERLDFRPDLTMMGKVIGGGFPVGAVGGRRDVMAVLDPAVGKAQASGTFSANPVTMRAGHASLIHLTADAIARMDRLAERFADGIEQAALRTDLPLWIRRAGPLVSWHFYDPGDGVVAQAARPDLDLMRRQHLALLINGVSPVPRAAFVTSSVMTDDLIDDAVDRFGRSLSDLATH